MSKEVLFSKEARERMLRGMDVLNEAVSCTLGPKGRNVVFDKDFQDPIITNDGVTIAKEIECEDPFENMGVRLLRQVAGKTNDDAGDGTTTATLLACTMIHSAIEAVDRGMNPILLRKGMNLAQEEVTRQLKEMATEVKDLQEIAHVATISSQDEKIGELIASAMDRCGKDCIITVEESKSFHTTLEIEEGLQIERGYVSPFMVPDQTKTEIELMNPLVLITDYKINTIHELIPILEKVMQTSRPLLIIADDFDNEVIATLILNRLKGAVMTVGIRTPGFQDQAKDLLQDIAVATGGRFFCQETKDSLKNAMLSDLGEAEKIIVKKEETIIVKGKGEKDQVDERVKMIERSLADMNYDFEKETAQKRLAKLKNGIAVIKAGASTQTEMLEKKFRIEDAIHATKAALEEGIIPGGGFALAKIAAKGIQGILFGSEDEKKGALLVIDALFRPLYQIAENAGMDGREIVRMQNQMAEGIGFDAMDGTWKNLMNHGILDPVKVTRLALCNAVSIAGLFITTQAAIALKNDESKIVQLPQNGY